MPDGKYENNLRANEVNIKQTGSWECLHVLLNMHKPLHPHSFATKCLLSLHLLLPCLVNLFWCLASLTCSLFRIHLSFIPD
ncbi:unnamed protein product [Tetraodon nigroviridis]|uniref:(spotted green pufferfish) hypothetical protein n=1 Tax=Tetraodon nigroviridis TaxID=99883 RepID=Q4RUN8_TETNG|nr:unnamed protein product [Tetraodon nigroviridis]